MDTAAPIRARCQIHPGSASIAPCDGCGRGLCLDCAIPVRGQVVGSECLASVLPDPPPLADPPPEPPRRSLQDRVTLACLGVAAIASTLPWTRFGVSSSWFGPWGFSPYRHSTLVGPIAVVAFVVLWFASRPPASVVDRLRAGIPIVGGVLISALSILALTRPPAFTRPSLVPYVAVAAGLAAALSGPLVARLRPDRTNPALA
jgi:hypothetical protein